MLTAEWPWQIETAWGVVPAQPISAQEAVFTGIPVNADGLTTTLHIKHGQTWTWELRQTGWAGTGYSTPKAALLAACQHLTASFGIPCVLAPRSPATP